MDRIIHRIICACARYVRVYVRLMCACATYVCMSLCVCVSSVVTFHVSGDVLLPGQIRGMVGVLIAIMRGARV